jgi:hypothetical protein
LLYLASIEGLLCLVQQEVHSAANCHAGDCAHGSTKACTDHSTCYLTNAPPCQTFACFDNGGSRLLGAISGGCLICLLGLLERIDKRDNIGYDAQRLAGTLCNLSSP